MTTVAKIVEERCIEEILHFTTNVGLLGILDCQAVKSRERLTKEQRLEFILKLNTPFVKDPDWIDYVNLSITRINENLFQISSRKWHPDVWWVILSFAPEILTHEGVYFTTTNNTYPCVGRGCGTEGLSPLFEPRVKWGHYGSMKTRTRQLPLSCPTCSQAEVLYLGELSTEYLRKIYVSKEEEADDAYGQMAGVGHRDIDVEIRREVFLGNPC